MRSHHAPPRHAVPQLAVHAEAARLLPVPQCQTTRCRPGWVAIVGGRCGGEMASTIVLLALPSLGPEPATGQALASRVVPMRCWVLPVRLHMTEASRDLGVASLSRAHHACLRQEPPMGRVDERPPTGMHSTCWRQECVAVLGGADSAGQPLGFAKPCLLSLSYQRACSSRGCLRVRLHVSHPPLRGGAAAACVPRPRLHAAFDVQRLPACATGGRTRLLMMGGDCVEDGSLSDAHVFESDGRLWWWRPLRVLWHGRWGALLRLGLRAGEMESCARCAPIATGGVTRGQGSRQLQRGPDWPLAPQATPLLLAWPVLCWRGHRSGARCRLA